MPKVFLLFGGSVPEKQLERLRELSQCLRKER
jgi:hypothetical protein